MSWQVSGSGMMYGVKSNDEAIKKASEYGLGFEAPLGKNLYLAPENVEKIVQSAEDSGFALTLHGPYYTSCACNPEVAHLSRHPIEYLSIAASFAKDLSAPVVIHPGGKRLDSRKQMILVASRLIEATEEVGLPREMIRIENMGRTMQFGSISEIYALAKVYGFGMCVDFAHLYATEMAETGEFKISQVEKILRLMESLSHVRNNAHFHISGMNWNHHGELNHERFEDSEFPYFQVLQSIVSSELSGVIVVESDKIMFRDARMVLEIVKELES